MTIRVGAEITEAKQLADTALFGAEQILQDLVAIDPEAAKHMEVTFSVITSKRKVLKP